MKKEVWLPEKPSMNAGESSYVSALILEMKVLLHGDGGGTYMGGGGGAYMGRG